MTLEQQAIDYMASVIVDKLQYITRSEISEQELKDKANEIATIIVKGE